MKVIKELPVCFRKITSDLTRGEFDIESFDSRLTGWERNMEIDTPYMRWVDFTLDEPLPLSLSIYDYRDIWLKLLIQRIFTSVCHNIPAHDVGIICDMDKRYIEHEVGLMKSFEGLVIPTNFKLDVIGHRTILIEEV